MLFQSPEFALLLLLTLAVFYARSGRQRLTVLCFASIAFYAFSGLIDTLVFFSVLLLTYFLSRHLRPGGSKIPLLLILSLLFINLAVFKYGGFIYDNLQVLLQTFGLTLTLRRPALWLPVGISFYTFQLAAYAVDVARGKLKPSTSLTEFIAFIMFFGQLIAGPIMRGGDFLPQFRHPLGARADDFRAGTALILAGLTKKVILADRLGTLVDARWLDWSNLSHAGAWITLYLFAFQIYLDFSGYSDIGIGLGRLFGLRLTPNFASPYLAPNPTDFWRRWHITLSTWLKDYLYIPLGGNRCPEGRRNLNLLATMVLGGLWHGAAWTFVAWGALQGLSLIAHKQWLRLLARVGGGNWQIPRPINIFLNFHLICLGWALFRAGSLSSALFIIRQCFAFGQLATWRGETGLLAISVLLFLTHWAEHQAWQHQAWLRQRWTMVPAPLRGLVYMAVVFLLILGLKPAQPFIYFRF